jgi:hypothetical protein
MQNHVAASLVEDADIACVLDAASVSCYTTSFCRQFRYVTSEYL